MGNAWAFLWELVQHRHLLLMILVLGLGGNLLIGFQVSAIAYPSQDIKRFLNASWVRRHRAPLAPETLTLLWSSIVSIYCLGGFLGGLWSGTLIPRHGK
ncbi:solute carrier family 2, facilitated glucose transporter member 9-like [Sceloporus undulatus]|uniref:solute carrier family 2, facilitated glucose transporter member 9-like n=1 Tax=Sceloporus undulatus TaxID=8520 RepID=UPI001C4CA16C|nr:solute carrier family 2, facilitated glucose transporter member 9-like [Sceloporus undulatus]